MRLIDADELLKKFVISESGARIPEIDINGFPVRVMIKEVKDVIRQQPTVLQEPERKHGYWFKGEQLFPVCPNCGAIMDGEESNDTKSKEKETD
ncbi:hypothetical protein AALA24_02235 [Anaerovoracaceae bacterium 42-11]